MNLKELWWPDHLFFSAVKKEKPKFLKKPTNKEVKETEDVVFETQVTAKPEPTVEWYAGQIIFTPA